MSLGNQKKCSENIDSEQPVVFAIQKILFLQIGKMGASISESIYLNIALFEVNCATSNQLQMVPNITE